MRNIDVEGPVAVHIYHVLYTVWNRTNIQKLTEAATDIIRKSNPYSTIER